MSLKLKEKQELFKLLQQAFFVDPKKNGTYKASSEGDTIKIEWDICAEYNWDKASGKLKKQLADAIPAKGEKSHFGTEYIDIIEENGKFIVKSENSKLKIEKCFDVFNDADSQILSILAARCLDFNEIKNQIASIRGISADAVELKYIPKDILALRIFINSQNVYLGDIDTGRLKDLTYAFSVYSDNQVQENPRRDFSGIEKWDTSNVTNMLGVFAGCVNFNHDISMWNTSKVTKMDVMFASCKHFNQDISKWDMSNVESMKGMFYKCDDFNCDISGWDTAKVKDFSYMFFKCKSFSKDIHEWNMDKGAHDECMFLECPIDEEFKPTSPASDFKREYYEKYVGPNAKSYQRQEVWKKIGLALAFGALIVVFSIFGQQGQ